MFKAKNTIKIWKRASLSTREHTNIFQGDLFSVKVECWTFTIYKNFDNKFNCPPEACFVTKNLYKFHEHPHSISLSCLCGISRNVYVGAVYSKGQHQGSGLCFRWQLCSHSLLLCLVSFVGFSLFWIKCSWWLYIFLAFRWSAPRRAWYAPLFYACILFYSRILLWSLLTPKLY